METKKRNLDSFVKDRELKETSPEKLELSARRIFDTLNDMTEIFLPKDVLLGSGGIFPLYYWLVKNSQEMEFRFIREFLVYFEKERRAAQGEDRAKSDKELVAYNLYNRSTNDLQSHENRYKILCKKFMDWKKKRS